jgi:phosphate starvation-inducible PhoH-like protein
MEVLQALYEMAERPSPADTVQLMLAGDGESLARRGRQPGAAHPPRRPARAHAEPGLYLDNIATHDITFGIGPAGTGKTYLAVASAVDALERSVGAAHRADAPGGGGRRASGLFARRPGAEGGPLPAPAVRRAVRPDGLRQGAKAFERNALEIAPLGFMRGRTLNNAFVILDEAQNTTPEQMKMFLDPHRLRRQGGDHRRREPDRPAQDPAQRPDRRRARAAPRQGHRHVPPDQADVVRHPLVARIVDAYDQRGRSAAARKAAE